MNPSTFLIFGLMENLLLEIRAEGQRKHEQKMKELDIISNSSLRDAYAQQLLLDKFLAPVEKAQHQLQNAAKHAQRLAELLNYYYRDHNATKEQGQEISRELRILATKITYADSLYELKIIYEAATRFTHELAIHFKRKDNDRKYSLEREIRKGILDVLNTCIAVENNFQKRIDLTSSSQNISDKPIEGTRFL